MGECRFENSSGRSVDPWCDEHNRSAILCLRWMRIERDESLKALEEREHDVHLRVRAGYDRAIADAWRAKVAAVERERDEARRERDEARRAAERERDEAIARAEAAERELEAARRELDAARYGAKESRSLAEQRCRDLDAAVQRAEMAERRRDELAKASWEVLCQRDEARREAEAERDNLCRMSGQPREERLLPWEREEDGDA